MIEVPLTVESLRVATHRIRDFASVHSGKDDYAEAFVVLRDSLGIDDDLIEALAEETATLLGKDTDPLLGAGILFGLMVGLIAADHDVTKP